MIQPGHLAWRCVGTDYKSLTHLPGPARLMVFKLLCAASKTWRRLKGTNQLPKVIAGVRFENGIEVIQVSANHAA
jgi:hypothetical protein